MNEPISVTALNQYVKGLLDRDRLLAQVYVCGELSNYKRYPSGHHYFSLKDAESAVRCVLFRREAAHLRFQLENGMRVLVSGRVSVYPRDGAYQLYCDRMTPDGVGELALAYEQMKSKLRKEGLFDPARKKPLPDYPQRIALVTSPAGAAVGLPMGDTLRKIYWVDDVPFELTPIATAYARARGALPRQRKKRGIAPSRSAQTDRRH